MQDETIETLQVTAPPGSPNGAGETEHDSSNPGADPPATDPPETGTPGAGDEDGDQSDPELDAIAAEADTLINPDIEPPDTSKTEDETGQRQFTAEEKLDYLVNTVYGLDQRLQQQEKRTGGQGGGDADGLDDLYNSGGPTGDPDPALDPNNPLAEEVKQLRETVSELEGVVRGVHTKQTTIDKNFEAREQEAAERTEISSLQEEYNLSEVDAKRSYALIKSGKIADGMRYARGRSQVESATNEMREQRAEDRSLSGRSALPGGTRSQPRTNAALLETKAKEYQEMPPGPARDDLANWLIDNGGMDYLRQEAVNLSAQLGTTNPNAVV